MFCVLLGYAFVGTFFKYMWADLRPWSEVSYYFKVGNVINIAGVEFLSLRHRVLGQVFQLISIGNWEELY